MILLEIRMYFREIKANNKILIKGQEIIEILDRARQEIKIHGILKI